MKYEAWEKEKPTPGIVRLRLVEYDRYIELRAVDKYGDRVERGSLLKIRSEGTIMMMENIDEELGFQLTSKGEIQIVTED